ncbi:hypothetical protein LTR16_011588, partial [Cryomyces antarcticus]
RVPVHHRGSHRISTRPIQHEEPTTARAGEEGQDVRSTAHLSRTTAPGTADLRTLPWQHPR